MLPALLLGCSAVPMAPGSAVAQEASAETVFTPPPRGTSDDAQLMYEIMISELAGRRGRLDIALEGYGAAAARTEDTRVAERAARLAIFARRWDAAGTALARWRALDGEASEPLELQAQVLMRQQRPAQAAERFAESVERAPDTEIALAELGALLQGDPDAPSARVVADALVTRYPDSAQARLGVARLALADGQGEAAIEALDVALRLDPDNLDAILVRARLMAANGDPDAGFTLLDAALERNPASTPLRLGRARLLAETGRLDEAGAALESLDGEVDDDADALLAIGQLAMQLQRPALAAGRFERLLALGEYRDEAHFQLARISDVAGNAPEAIAAYDAVMSEALFVPSRTRAAELVAQQGDLDAARQRLASLREMVLDPDVQARLFGTEGRLLQRAGAADDALALLDDALEAFPGNGDLRYARALAADGAGRPQQLVDDLRQLIEAEPDNAQALNALGYHFVQQGERLDEAAGLLEKASALLPDDPAVMDSLGWLRFKQGDTEQAVQLLTRALAMLPDAEIAAHLGEALWTTGRQDEARRVWDEALVGSPDHEVLNETIERLTR